MRRILDLKGKNFIITKRRFNGIREFCSGGGDKSYKNDEWLAETTCDCEHCLWSFLYNINNWNNTRGGSYLAGFTFKPSGKWFPWGFFW